MDSLEIFEIEPIEWDRGRKVIHIYKRVKVQELSAQKIRDLYVNLAFKTLPTVTDLKDCFLITYYPKPPIMISKTNGRLYSSMGSWDLKEGQHQASLVMRVLSEFDLVEEHTRKSLRSRL